MSTNNTKQSGFSMVIGVIAAVLVIGIIGFIGWRLYNQSSQQTNNATSGNSNTSSQSSNEGTTATTTTPQSTYLDIKELGIKIKLDDSIKDAVYSYSPANNSQYPQYVGGVNISTQSLIDKDTACKPASGANPLGSINELSTNQDGLGHTLVPDGTTIFKLGNNYYVLSTPQSPCSTNSSVNTLAAQQRATFFEDFKTVQLDR